MKLTYHEDTPEDYEPPHFKPITEEGLGHFARKPFSMNLGDVSTNHHAVSLRVKSLLDSCNEGLDEHCNSGQCSTYPDDVEGNEVASGLQDNEARDDMVTPEIADGMEADKDAHVADDVEADIEVVKATAPEAEEEADPAAQAEHTLLFKPNPKDRLAGDLEDLMTAPQDQSEPAYMDVMPLKGEGPAAADNAPGAAFSPDAAAKYDAVMEFCLRKGQVLFTTLMTEFVNIHLGDLERFLQKMVQEGLLEPTQSKDAYRVIKQSDRAGDPLHAVMESTRGADHSVLGPDGSEYQTAQQQQQQHVTDQLGNLSVHRGGGAQGSGERAGNSRKRAAEDSQAAKVSHKGSEITNSAVHGQSAAMSFNRSVISPSHLHAQPSQPKDNFAWVESQQSMDNPKNKPRKASLVEKPIRQSKKQRTDLKASASGMPARQHVTRAMAKADGTKTKFQMMN
ncbi:TPA: HORMA domain-containing protein [Trebouxia sp. C0005]